MEDALNAGTPSAITDGVTDEQLAAAISAWLPGLRWYAGKGRPITSAKVLARADLAGPEPGQAVIHLVVGVEVDASEWQVYQVPLLAIPGTDVAGSLRRIAGINDLNLYDALSDELAPALLAGWVADEPVVDPAVTHAHGEQRPHLQAIWDPRSYLKEPARALSVEQSNTSLRFGTAALMKVFRRLNPGVNPDVEVSAALGRVGCESIPEILGWVNGSWQDPGTNTPVTGHLAMVQELLSPAVDGWDLSRERVAAGLGFADDSYRLGLATGAVHRDLRAVLPTHVLDPAEVTALVARLQERLVRAANEVPEIAEIAEALAQRISAISQVEVPIQVQRVHGDFHLGQVLLARAGWRLLDFEGEPGGAIAERVVPDHPLRDVAAMLRSYDYAANMGGQGRDAREVQQWRRDCEDAFLRGYHDAGPEPEAQGGAQDRAAEILLAAYTVDKAAYEAVYEKRNRPDWLPIPLAALRSIANGR
jgi:maltokinase